MNKNEIYIKSGTNYKENDKGTAGTVRPGVCDFR